MTMRDAQNDTERMLRMTMRDAQNDSYAFMEANSCIQETSASTLSTGQAL